MSRPHRWPRRHPVLVSLLLVTVTWGLTVTAAVALRADDAPPVSFGGAFTPAPTQPATIAPAAQPSPQPSAAQPPAGWSVVRSSDSGAPLVATSLVHPDPGGQRSFVGAAWLSRTDLRFTLVPGTQQPGDRWTTQGEVPPALRPGLVAVFNSGFKYRDITGGFQAEGREARPLVDGQASLVVRADGTASVGEWGHDVGPAPDVVAVRQNLEPIVADGRAVAGLLTRHDDSWGKERWQTQRTARSALGQLQDGALVYVAGPDMDLQQLADALVSVHAVRGMQLDIHTNMETFHIFDPGDGPGPGPTRELLDLMTAASDRYLVPDTRDFIAVTTP